jgi:DNA (cytosine-5)-methyltransferase 1
MGNDTSFQFRISTEEKDSFLKACKKRGHSASKVARELIQEYSRNALQLSGLRSSAPSTSRAVNRKNVLKKSRDCNFKVGELYCGPGGLGLATEFAEIRYKGKRYACNHAWATDSDSDSCQTYLRNVLKNDNGKIICDDVRNLDISNLPKIDALHFGFPCNDYSIVGETKGLHGDYGPLYSYGVEVLEAHNPKWFLAENVTGITSANQGEAFQKIAKELSSAGPYGYITTVHLYRFEDYGIPQARHRIILVGIRRDLNLRFLVPQPSFLKTTARQAIEDPPIPENAKNHELTRQSPTVVERLKHIKPGQNAWNADLPDHLRLNVKNTQLSHIYKRLDPDKPSYTITGSGGGGTHGYHWKEPRALTSRERARLQTFPDYFEFFGSKESVRKQIGMSIPVKGAEIIVNAILKTIAGAKYSAVEPSIGYIGETPRQETLFSK